MDLGVFVRSLRKNWWLLVITIVAGFVVASIGNASAQRVYASTLTMYVSTSPGSVSNPSAISDDQSAQRRANSYVFLAGSERLAKMIIDSTDVDLSPQELMTRITAEAPPSTVLVNVTVEDANKGRSLEIARGVASQFPDLVNELDDNGSSRPTISLELVSGPTLHAAPVSPRTSLNLAIGLLAGLLAGLLLVVARELFDTSIRSSEDVTNATGQPVLGTIISDRAIRNAPLLLGDETYSLRAEEYRQLRTNLTFADVDRPLQVIVVSSATAGDGKSTTAANFSLVVAESKLQVLLVEADMRKPQVSQFFGVAGDVGLSDVLAGNVTVDQALRPWSDYLTILPSGSTPPNPSELLGSHRMDDLMTQLRERFDVIVVDTPPLLPVTDAAVAAAHADGVLVVFRYGRTSRRQAKLTMSALSSVDSHTLGCVLNRLPARQSDARNGYGKGYYNRTVQPRWWQRIAPPEAGGSAGTSDESANEPADDELVEDETLVDELAYGPDDSVDEADAAMDDADEVNSSRRG